MPHLAYVFPGQGSQSVGMGRGLAETSAAAAAVFEAADAALGEPISTLAWDGPAEQLDRTENAIRNKATKLGVLLPLHNQRRRPRPSLHSL